MGRVEFMKMGNIQILQKLSDRVVLLSTFLSHFIIGVKTLIYKWAMCRLVCIGNYLICFSYGKIVVK